MIRTLPVDLFWTVWMILASAGIGRKALGAARSSADEEGPDAHGLLMSLGSGLAILSLLVLGLGMAGMVSRRGYLILLAAASVLCSREILLVLREAVRLAGLSIRGLSGRFEVFLAAVLLSAAAANLIFNYSPPTQAREMLYDLTLPKIYLQLGRIRDVPDQKEFYYPMAVQMLYLMGMGLRSALVAKLLHFFLGLACAAAVAAVTRRFFRGSAALPAAVIFYLMPLVTSLSGTANIDLGTLFFGLIAFSSLALWLEGGGTKALALAGFFSGAALGSKVTGISVVTAGAALAFFLRSPEEPPGISRAVRRTAVFLFAAGLSVGPWLVRNAVFTGNPLAPFAVPALGWKAHEGALIELRGLEKAAGNVPASEILRGTRNLLVGDIIFGGGPLVLAFLLAGIYGADGKRNLRILLAFALANFAVLLLALPYPHRFYENRYYALTTGLLAVPAGLGLDWFGRVFKSKGWVRGLAGACLLFPCLALSLLFGARRIPLFLGFQSQESYLAEKLPFYSHAVYANKNLPRGSKVLMLGSSDAHAFYWDASLVPPSLELLAGRDPEDVAKLLWGQGITHVLYFEGFYRREDGALKHTENSGLDLHWDMPKMRASHLAGLFRSAGVILYRVDYSDLSDRVHNPGGIRFGGNFG